MYVIQIGGLFYISSGKPWSRTLNLQLFDNTGSKSLAEIGEQSWGVSDSLTTVTQRNGVTLLSTSSVPSPYKE